MAPLKLQQCIHIVIYFQWIFLNETNNTHSKSLTLIPLFGEEEKKSYSKYRVMQNIQTEIQSFSTKSEYS